MAKQNIISGGFYGKVGQLIGQRWRNIRTVRSYVKPKNPRTEEQQANRFNFANVTKNAQIGLQMNYKAPCFEGIDNSEWAVRMSCGSFLRKEGQEGFNLIPLFPYGYIPRYVINRIELAETRGSKTAVFGIEGNLPTKNRNISVLIGTKQREDDEYEIELYNALLVAGDYATFEIEFSNVGKLNRWTKFLIVSNDDRENGNETVYASQQTMQEPEIIERPFDTTIVGIVRDNLTFKLVFNEDYLDADYEIGQFTIEGVSNGEVVQKTFTPSTFVDYNGKFAVEFSQSAAYDSEIMAFPNGSNVDISHIKVNGARLILTADNESKNFSSTDLTRNLNLNIVDVSDDGTDLILKTNQPYIVSTYSLASKQAYAYINANRTGFSANVEVFKGTDSNVCFRIKRNDSDYTEKPLFLSSSAINFGEVSTVAEGVTYKATITNVSATESNPYAIINTTVANVERSGNVYTVKTTNPYLSRLVRNTELKLHSVQNGRFTDLTVSVSPVQVDSALGFRFTMDNLEHESLLPAFPVGSKLEFAQAAGATNGNYIVKSGEVQNYNNSDLIRKFWSARDTDYEPVDNECVYAFKQKLDSFEDNTQTFKYWDCVDYFEWREYQSEAVTWIKDGESVIYLESDPSRYPEFERTLNFTNLKGVGSGVTYEGGSANVYFATTGEYEYDYDKQVPYNVDFVDYDSIGITVEVPSLADTMIPTENDFFNKLRQEEITASGNFYFNYTQGGTAKAVQIVNASMMEWIDETHLRLYLELERGATGADSGTITKTGSGRMGIQLRARNADIPLADFYI